ncbi:hypothetical protein INT80_00265 [Gallibacterium anatis]|uniref:HK97 gp10 family phage protein n=1 Tax=Gallibacterium anatis TaxID=750 RepID=A0A930UQI3_9PAST|nr:hypothetical protein [Gallibacterium anatis]
MAYFILFFIIGANKMSVSVKITGLKELNNAFKHLDKEMKREARKGVRKALNAGAKEIKKALKPVVPIMAKGTNFRQKGVLKKTIRHKTDLDKGKLTGNTTVYFSDRNASKTIKERERRRAGADGKLHTGPITIYQNDPFFWHMVDRGTANG